MCSGIEKSAQMRGMWDQETAAPQACCWLLVFPHICHGLKSTLGSFT